MGDPWRTASRPPDLRDRFIYNQGAEPLASTGGGCARRSRSPRCPRTHAPSAGPAGCGYTRRTTTTGRARPGRAPPGDAHAVKHRRWRVPQQHAALHDSCVPRGGPRRRRGVDDYSGPSRAARSGRHRQPRLRLGLVRRGGEHDARRHDAASVGSPHRNPSQLTFTATVERASSPAIRCTRSTRLGVDDLADGLPPHLRLEVTKEG